MKKILFLVGFFAALCATSCAATKVAQNFDADGDFKNAQYHVRNVEAVVDFARQDDIASQLKSSVEILLGGAAAAEKNLYAKLDSAQDFISADDEFSYFVDFTVRQRSFVKDVSCKNSIYVAVSLKDAAERAVGQFCFYVSGCDTVLSASQQYKIARKIAKKINSQRK